MSASSSSLMRSSFLCRLWTKYPLVLISATRSSSCLRVTLRTSGGQSGPLSTSSGLWLHRDVAVFKAAEFASSSLSIVRLWWGKQSACVNTGITYSVTPSPNSSMVVWISWATSWLMLDPEARTTRRKACGPGRASWRLLRASMALLLFPIDVPKRSGVSIALIWMPFITCLCWVLSVNGPICSVDSHLPSKVCANEARPAPAGPKRIILRPSSLTPLLDSSVPSLGDPGNVTQVH